MARSHELTRDVAASVPTQGYVSRRFTNTYTSGYYFSSELWQGTQSDTRRGESRAERQATGWLTPHGGSLRNTVPIPGSSPTVG